MIKNCKLAKDAKHSGENRGRICHGKKALFLLLVCLVAIGGLYCLGLMNSKAEVGFKMSGLQAKLNNLKEINKNLEVESSELAGVSRVQAAAMKLGMINTERVEYLTAKEAGLARR